MFSFHILQCKKTLNNFQFLEKVIVFFPQNDSMGTVTEFKKDLSQYRPFKMVELAIQDILDFSILIGHEVLISVL